MKPPKRREILIGRILFTHNTYYLQAYEIGTYGIVVHLYSHVTLIDFSLGSTIHVFGMNRGTNE